MTHDLILGCISLSDQRLFDCSELMNTD